MYGGSYPFPPINRNPNNLEDSLTTVPPSVHYSAHDNKFTQWGLDEYDDALAEATRLHDDNERLLREKNGAVDFYAAVRRDLDGLQEQVRAVLIELHEEGKLNSEDVNEALSALDLPGTKREYEVTVIVSQSIMVTVEASSENEASEMVDEMGSQQVVRNHGDVWAWDMNIEYVCEA